jgi:hypothetical protein
VFQVTAEMGVVRQNLLGFAARRQGSGACALGV